MVKDQPVLAYSYRRWSTAEQATGSSLHRQENKLGPFCKLHNLTLSDTYEDAGISSYRGKNRTQGALATFLQAVEDKAIPKGSWLLLDSFDRLTRQPIDEAQPIVTSILQAGITIAILNNNQIFKPESRRDPGTVIPIIIALEVGYKESEIKSHRASGYWNKVRSEISQGIAPSKLIGRLPFWLEKISPSECRVVPKWAEIINRIFALYLDGMGPAPIARTLNNENVLTLKGNQWSSAGVNQLLRNKAVLGIFQPNKIEYIDNKKRQVPTGVELKIYPPVVSEEIFNRAQGVKAKRQITITPERKQSFVNIGQGIVKCPCGHAMRILRTQKGVKKDILYWICRSSEQGKLCSYRKNIRFDLFQKELVKGLLDPDIIQAFSANSKESNYSKNLREIEGRIAVAQQELNNLNTILLENIGNLDYSRVLASTLASVKATHDKAISDRDAITAQVSNKSAHWSDDCDLLMELCELQIANKDLSEAQAKATNQLLKRHFSIISWSGKERLITFKLNNSEKLYLQEIGRPFDLERSRAMSRMLIKTIGNLHLGLNYEVNI